MDIFYDYMVGDIYYQYEKPNNIKEWEEHIFSLLENKFYQKIDVRIFDKLELSDSIDPNKIGGFYQDLVLFILLVLYLEIPYTFELYDKYYHNEKFQKKVKKIRKETLDHIQGIMKHMGHFILTFREIYKKENKTDHSTAEKHIDKLLTDYFKNTYEISEMLLNPYEPRCDIDNSLKYSNLMTANRKLKSKTGIRDLSLRYITLIFQICFFKVSSSLYEVIYQLLDKIMPYDKEGNCMMYSMTLDDMPKYIKKNIIQYQEDKKFYGDEFLGFKNHMPYIPEDRQDLEKYNTI